MGGGFNSERLNRVVALCDRYVNDGKFPCAQVQIAHKGEIVLRHTVGKSDIETDRELAENAIFRIYSMTKPLTSIALMQLYEQNLFTLDDDVDGYLPFDVNHPSHPLVPVTFKMLLSHTSGIKDNWSIMPYYDGDSNIELEDYLNQKVVQNTI